MKVFRCFGNKVEILERLNAYKYKFEFDLYSSCYDNLIKVSSITDDEFDDLIEEIDDIVYNDEDISLEQTFVNFTLANDVKFAIAESCTGGMIASDLVAISGVSKVFYEGIITYSNEAKIKRLGVSEFTLESYGAVSEQTAKEMAYGLLDNEVDIGFATTGIAGPDGGTEEKPVGLVYIGVASSRSEPIAIKCNFEGTRQQIRRSAKNAAIFYALCCLKENY
ncbi:MAG: nicotinamide-nucleotide amidohydrolase family protein [Clostridia bacterium]